MMQRWRNEQMLHQPYNNIGAVGAESRTNAKSTQPGHTDGLSDQYLDPRATGMPRDVENVSAE
jgi:hypothetical protein